MSDSPDRSHCGWDRGGVRRRRLSRKQTAGLLVTLVALTALRSADDEVKAPTAPAAAQAAPSASEVAAAPTETATPRSALALLAALPVKGRAANTGYDRSAYGPAWADVDRDGCDTRNDVLARDLAGVTFRGTRRCVVLTGRLVDPYTRNAVVFTKANAQVIEIDHVVSLSNAWQTGASAWPAAKRLAFANDPLNLLAVSREANRAKSDGDAATWLPPAKAYRCAFVARQTAVKAKYGLWVTAAERDAIARVLGTCPEHVAPARTGPTAAPAINGLVGGVPTPAPTRTTAAPATSRPAVIVTDYANCDAMHEDYIGGVSRPGAIDRRRNGGTAKHAPYVSQALYDANRESDGDDDGVACEQ